MGASVSGYWSGITDSQYDQQPGFKNDCQAWGEWMAELEQHPEVFDALDDLEVAAVGTFTTDGMEEEDVYWVTPQELEDAALRLRELVLAQDEAIKSILRTYAISANKNLPIHLELAQDLSDVASIARFAKQLRVPQMTLEVNW